MNPYLIIAAFLAIAASGVGGFKLGVDHEIASQAREDQHIAQAVDAANATAAAAIAQIKVTHRAIYNKTITETTSAPVYRDPDCRNSAGGMQLIQAALANGQPTDSGKLPTADAVK